MTRCHCNTNHSGKTTLLNVLASGMTVETAPTIGLNVKQVKKGGTTLKVWDIGGQKQYRSEWRRYTKGCDVIIFVVDAYAHDQIGEARVELHRLLEDRDLATTPILVCSNKVDLEPHISEHELIKSLNLDYLIDNPVSGRLVAASCAPCEGSLGEAAHMRILADACFAQPLFERAALCSGS